MSATPDSTHSSPVAPPTKSKGRKSRPATQEPQKTQPFPVPYQPRMNPAYPINGYQHQQPSSNNAPHPPYPYPPIQYTTHPYHPYTPYPHPIMYSPPAHQPQPPPPAQPQPVHPVSSGSKRKRQSMDPKSKSTEKASDNDEPVDMHKKRTKTQRACDSCRARKIRCDVLADTDPPMCQHCKQYAFDCTFFLPITETRFKKKKLEEEAAAAAAAASQSDKEHNSVEPSAKPSPKPEPHKGEVRIYGPTSMTHLLHSTATVPHRAYESYDIRYHHTWEVSKSGDGFIQVLEPKSEDQRSMSINLHVDRDVIERLINSYFTDVAPLIPIITQAEFLSDPSPPPILLYSICLVAAAKRDVPHPIFQSLRDAVNNLIKSEDILSTASIVNVQSLLIMSQCGDCHSPFGPNALSSLWVRLGSAIRMAQDLGLHRAEAVKQNIEMRRRLWGACVISDRWVSLTFGHPYMIDVEDCDARLPSSGDPSDNYTDELVRLSLILGQVMKTIYSPSGLTRATDEKLNKLLDEIKSWREKLPEDLKFRGPQTSRNGGLLHLLFSCVCMIFWRVFMRISYSCPAHLKFGLTVDRWTDLVKMTGDSIDWLEANENVYDVWMLVVYAITSCALVQYHTWARRKDADAQNRLRKLRDLVVRWEDQLPPDHMSTRRKTAEIIKLLYETTQGPPVNFEEPPLLNPTGGVRGKKQFKGLAYKKDPARPGGGVFIAHGDAKKGDYGGIPEGVILPSSGSEEDSEGEAPVKVSTVERPANDSSIPLSHTTSQSSSRSGHHGRRAVAPATAVPHPTRYRNTPRNSMGSAPPNVGLQQQVSPVGFHPMEGNHANVNPALNVQNMHSTDVQILNVLDMPQAPHTLEQVYAEQGLLDGIPGGMFDWPQWDQFFSRFNHADAYNHVAAAAAASGGAVPMNGTHSEHQTDPRPPGYQYANTSS